MAEISAVDGGVLANGAQLEASEWSADLDQATPDRSSWLTAGEPLNAAGQRTGTITVSGPASTLTALTAKGVARGSVVTFKLYLSVLSNVFIQVNGRVSKFAPKNDKDNGPGWSITAAQYGAATIQGI